MFLFLFFCFVLFLSQGETFFQPVFVLQFLPPNFICSVLFFFSIHLDILCIFCIHLKLNLSPCCHCLDSQQFYCSIFTAPLLEDTQSAILLIIITLPEYCQSFHFAYNNLQLDKHTSSYILHSLCSSLMHLGQQGMLRLSIWPRDANMLTVVELKLKTLVIK